MALAIPCSPGRESRWTQRTELDGREYHLSFQWNARTGHWSLSVADQDGDPIASGLVLVAGMDLLAGSIDARRPAGALVVIDRLGQYDLDPGFSDLGGRFVLGFLSNAELGRE